MGDVVVFVGADRELIETNFEVRERGRGQGNGRRGKCSFGVDRCGRHDWILRVVDSAVAGVGWRKKGGKKELEVGEWRWKMKDFKLSSEDSADAFISDFGNLNPSL